MDYNLSVIASLTNFISENTIILYMSIKVNDYIEKLKSPQKEICKKLRSIILSNYPSINEGMKYGVPYYNDNFYIVALKNQVNLGFSIKNLTAKEIALFEGDGKTMRHIKVRALGEIDDKRIIKLLDLVHLKN
ncbi:MAG: DUF1801 domain-containing protein [Candidatus Lokiarchaeota archaeon]|nr:DUF1801 domain-containing protein [Candidatus Lokiarchaeota archaeon]